MDEPKAPQPASPEPAPEPKAALKIELPNVADVKDKATEIASAAKENLTTGVTKSVEMVKEKTAKYGLMIMVALAVGVLLLILAYILYVYLSAKLSNKITVMIPDSKIPRRGTELSKLDGSMIPAPGNGNRMTYSFWIYIYDINKYSVENDIRHVMHFGEESTVGASPSVWLDGKENKMYIRFDKRTDTQTNPPTGFKERLDKLMKTGSAASNDPEKIQNAGFAPTATVNFKDAVAIDLAKRGVVIDYIPLQRWVHVTVLVNETVNRGYISVYLDGELVKTVSSKDKENLSVTGKFVTYNLQDLNLAKAGSIYVGGDIYSDNVARGFSGIVSKIMVSNYDLNGVEIKKIYMDGPVDNLSSKLGLPAYGVRSPVYRLG